MKITYVRQTEHNQRAYIDEFPSRYIIRSYGTEPRHWEVMDVRNSALWARLRFGIESEELAKQHVAELIARAAT